MGKLTYNGHECFIVDSEKGSIIIDPFITGNPNAKINSEDIKVNYILLTHGHGDHLGDGIEIAKRCSATVIAPFELATYCQSKDVDAHPMHIGGAYSFPFGRVKLTIAHHGSGIATENGFIYGGDPCGFLITIEDKTIYHSGDTGLFLDMKLIGSLNHIDIALLPIGGNFTMDADDALEAVKMLNPDLVIPMHYNTFDIIKTNPNNFTDKVKGIGKGARVMNFGETITF